MTTEQFIETMITIDQQDSQNHAYGHFPFQMVAIDKDGRLSIAALFLGGDVLAVFRSAKQMIKDGAVSLHLSIDFPAGLDVNSDFVAILTVQQGKIVECFAIPYSTVTGERLPSVKAGKMIDVLKNMIQQSVLSDKPFNPFFIN